MRTHTDKWTTPYHGVSHLKSVVRPYQATIAIHDNFTDATWFYLGGNHPYTTDKKEKTFYAKDHADHAEAARQWLEKMAAVHRDDYDLPRE